MPRFAANLSMMFPELPFEDRFAAARAAGFRAVEYLFPYDYPAEALAGLLEENGLRQVLFNLPAGDWAAGERGIAAIPGREGEFRNGIGRAIDYAGTIGCPRLNALAGVPPAGAIPEACRDTLVRNLAVAALALADAGLELTIEPINTRDIPGFFLNGTEQALSVIDEVGAPNLKLQYDVYHMQIMEGDLAETLRAHADRIGHIQIADVPGRHEPGTGEINYPFLFGLLDELGWNGWVGCEYKPAGATAEGLGWAEAWLS